jgi:DNA-binding NarL/FixJ family response regulator
MDVAQGWGFEAGGWAGVARDGRQWMRGDWRPAIHRLLVALALRRQIGSAYDGGGSSTMTTFHRSVEVLEASYRMDVTDGEWLKGIAVATRNAEPVRGVGMGTAGFMFEVGVAGTSFRSWELVMLDRSPDTVGTVSQRHASTTPQEIRERYWRQPVVCASLSELGLPSSPEQRALGVPELFGLQVTDNTGLGMCLLFALPAPIRMRRQTREHWHAVTQHVRAALRLRHALSTDGLWQRAAAVIEPGRDRGAVRAARGAASARSVQARLRHMASKIDKARTRAARQDGAAAVEAWPALVDGRWTLVEHFDSDGRRYYLAMENEPEAASLIALTDKEQLVARYAADGLSNKAIIDKLGMSEAMIAGYLRSAMHKLRVRKRAELAAIADEMAAMTGMELPVSEPLRRTMGANKLWLVHGGGASAAELAPFGFTPVELEVVRGILRGQSNAEIGQARGEKSARTVAVHVQSIFRKATAVRSALGERDTVSSRAELVHLINRLMLRPSRA